MNPSSDIGPVSSEESASAREGSPHPSPANWREAIMALIESRVDLIRLESKDVISDGVRRAIYVAVACGALLSAWALLLAGGISLIAETAGWHWNLVALGAALLHLVLGVIMVRCAATPPGAAAFPVTRSEFKKDREWIENFHNPRKSND